MHISDYLKNGRKKKFEKSKNIVRELEKTGIM